MVGLVRARLADIRLIQDLFHYKYWDLMISGKA
jgi:hypothetical protein